MRWLLLFSPLLLAGCSLFYFEVESPMVSIGGDGYEICRGTDADRECLTWSVSQHAGDESYTLTCEGVVDGDCQAVANRAVIDLRAGREARWVVVWPDWYEVCWVVPDGMGCEGHAVE